MSGNVEIWDEGECLPNYDFWKRTAYWTIEEGVALTLGKEPKSFNSTTLKDASKDISLVASFFEWLELANRAVHTGQLGKTPTPPEFLEWKAMMSLGGNPEGIEISNPNNQMISLFNLENDKGNPFSFLNYKESYFNLEAAYNAKCEKLDDLLRIESEYYDLCDELESGETTLTEPKPRHGLDNRRRKSFLKIILAVAITKYHFDPNKTKNSAPKNMETATLECGLQVTDETIRTLLREAVGCFPEIAEFFENE